MWKMSDLQNIQPEDTKLVSVPNTLARSNTFQVPKHQGIKAFNDNGVKVDASLISKFLSFALRQLYYMKRASRTRMELVGTKTDVRVVGTCPLKFLVYSVHNSQIEFSKIGTS
jgi:hypothetical protein